MPRTKKTKSIEVDDASSVDTDSDTDSVASVESEKVKEIDSDDSGSDSDSDSEAESDKETKPTKKTKSTKKPSKTASKTKSTKKTSKASVKSTNKTDDLDTPFEEVFNKLDDFVEFEKSFKELQESIKNLTKEYKTTVSDFRKKVKVLEKTCSKGLKKKVKRTVTQKPKPAPPQLLKYLGMDEDEEIARSQLNSKLCEKLKEDGCRDKGITTFNKKTAKIFDDGTGRVKAGESYPFGQFNSIIAAIYKKEGL